MTLPLADYVAKQKDIQAQMEALREQGKAVLIEALNALFEKYPALYRVRWTQYTPYFNDGDACTFRSNADYADINDDDGYGVDEDDDDDECWECDDECEDDCACSCHAVAEAKAEGAVKFASPEEETACRAEVHKLLGAFTEDDYYEFFDDHVVVEVTRAGVNTYEYSHD